VCALSEQRAFAVQKCNNRRTHTQAEHPDPIRPLARWLAGSLRCLPPASWLAPIDRHLRLRAPREPPTNDASCQTLGAHLQPPQSPPRMLKFGIRAGSFEA